MAVALVLITCGSAEQARTIAHELVGEKLAAGVQILPIESVYRWEGEVVEDDEVLLICKTQALHFDAIENVVDELHSYDVPPVLMLPIDRAKGSYLKWIDRETR